jgi:aspartate-semialdehyde dehydrogenase
MAERRWRGAVVGASTLLGKELAEELSKSTKAGWELTLLDAAAAGGQMTSAGDEVLVIQTVSAESFEGVDVVFFAGEAATAGEFWKAAHATGASIVDLTGALEGMPGVQLRSAWMETEGRPDLAMVAVVAVHPMAGVLALIEARLRPLGLTRLVATVLLPASELGSAGVDELQQQAVGLLTFKPLEKDVYDAQVGFNLLNALGDEAKVDLEKTRMTIARQAAALAAGVDVLALQVVQAPVFHGYTASVFVETASRADESDVRKALLGGVLTMATEDAPSNASAAGGSEVLVSVRPTGDGFWLWMAADNLRLAARNAEGCALELMLPRPQGTVN